MPLVLLKQTSIDFIGKRRLAYAASVCMLLVGLFSCLFGNGFRLGIDFAGGVIVQVRFDRGVSDEALKKSLDIPGLPGTSTQRFGEADRVYLLRFAKQEDGSSSDLRSLVLERLASAFPDNPSRIERMEVVGPKVGSDLTNKALSALYYAILLIAVYISGRFEHRWLTAALMAAILWGCMYAVSSLVSLSMGWLVLMALLITIATCYFLRLHFALGAILALIHDVVITTGFLSLANMDIDLNVIAALLTIIGYSLNDTIIIYDRLREHLRKKKEESLARIINKSVNQTLSRTLVTSATTIAAALALFFLGGGVIHSFALTMLIGVCIGTFSSIFISSSLLLFLGSEEEYEKSQEEEHYEKPGEHGVV
ncbi:MAG: protein translocase subunit SecF [Desulfovibrionaceae bacterium]|nr:protein translocase subunit SecF [Desulfovibrionaceae bacterium]